MQDGDLATIAAPLDFLGVNYYARVVARAGGERRLSDLRPRARVAVHRHGLGGLSRRLLRDARPGARATTRRKAIYITENGAAYGDVRGHDGSVLDPERQAYIADHLAAVARAMEDGAPVRGYYVWSLLDNFEWSHGYSKRFGIVFVDYPTLERVPKGSAHWYRDFIASQKEEPAWRASA